MVAVSEFREPLLHAVQHGKATWTGHVVEAVVAARHLEVRHRISTQVLTKQPGTQCMTSQFSHDIRTAYRASVTGTSMSRSPCMTRNGMSGWCCLRWYNGDACMNACNSK